MLMMKWTIYHHFFFLKKDIVNAIKLGLREKHMKSIRAKMLMWFGLTLGVLMIFVGVTTYAHIKDTVIPLTRGSLIDSCF